MPDKLRDGRKQGWFWLNNELWDQACQVIGPYAATVYVGLSRHADRDGRAFPHVKTLAQKGGMSERQVQLSLTKLDKHNMVKRLPKFNEKGQQIGNDYILQDALDWGGGGAGDAPGGVQVMHRGGAGDAPHIKETQIKEISSTEVEECPAEKLAETVPEKELLAKPYNYVKSFIDIWREVFPGEPDPDLPGRWLGTLKRRGQELTPARYEVAVRAYFKSEHYQAVQGGYNVKTFCDWPAETWINGKSRPPAARSPAGTLDDQLEAMRKMSEE